MNSALKGLSKLRDPERLQPWMYKILLRHWQQYLKREKRYETLDETSLTENDDPQASGQRHEICLAVKQAIYRLPVAQRQVVTLIDLEGLSYLEVSTVLGIPIGTVMSRLSRARATLARLLAKFGTRPKTMVRELKSAS